MSFNSWAHATQSILLCHCHVKITKFPNVSPGPLNVFLWLSRAWEVTKREYSYTCFTISPQLNVRVTVELLLAASINLQTIRRFLLGKLCRRCRGHTRGSSSEACTFRGTGRFTNWFHRICALLCAASVKEKSVTFDYQLPRATNQF